MKEKVIADLRQHKNEHGVLPIAPECIAELEATGKVVDLETGEVFHQNDIDALVIEVKESLKRIKSFEVDNHDYLRGYQRGVIAAYRDVLRKLGQSIGQ